MVSEKAIKILLGQRKTTVRREVCEVARVLLVRATAMAIYGNVAGEVLPSGDTVSAHVPRDGYRILAIPIIEFLLEGGRAVPLRRSTSWLLQLLEFESAKLGVGNGDLQDW